VGASLDCLALNNASFSSADLTNASFSRSLLRDARFDLADLTNSNFQEAMMDRSSFFLTKLTGANFSRASLVATQLFEFKGNWTDFSETNLYQAEILYANLTRTSFKRANVSEARFSSVYLENANFDQVFGDQSTFPFSRLPNATFRQASLFRASFLGVKGNGTDFSKANLNESTIQYAELREAIFQDVSMLNDANFRRAFLVQSSFYLTTIDGIDLSEANLYQATDLTQEQLDTSFSISNAILPDGSIGKNKNLVRYGHPACNKLTVTEWMLPIPKSVTIIQQANSTNCVYQSTTTSQVTRMEQSIDVNLYVKRMMQAESTYILVETDFVRGKINANLHLFNSENNLIDTGKHPFSTLV
jgi:uncharacterized protein YjbI with pentapeptide repeats